MTPQSVARFFGIDIACGKQLKTSVFPSELGFQFFSTFICDLGEQNLRHLKRMARW